MGIDIGSVRLIGQIGAPWSAASLKQRMGRSGRNPGDARRLRCYVDCTTIPEPSNPISLLPVELLQTVAIIELMLEGWVEPQGMSELDLSTLTHQIISTIAELGAISAVDLYCRLCQEGPFDKVSQDLCVRLLRGLGAADIIEQGADGLLILGLIGEKLRSRKDFYAAFASRTEFSVIAGSRTLGTLPIDALPKPGDHLVFAARRWQVTSVDIDRHELYVSPAKRRKKPIFLSSGGMVHHQVIERMMGVIGGQQDIPYLDAAAKKVISTARDHARSHDLSRRRRFALNEKKCVWLTWSGTAETMAYEALLASEGIESRSEIIGLVCDCKLADLDSIINKWITRTPDLMTLAMHIQPKRRRKYDEYLPDDLLEEGIASDLVWRGPI